MNCTVMRNVYKIRKVSKELLLLLETEAEIDNITALVREINNLVSSIERATGISVDTFSPKFGDNLRWLNMQVNNRTPKEAVTAVKDFLSINIDELKKGVLDHFGMEEKNGMINPKELGAGSFAKVIKGYDPAYGTMVACKIMYSSSVYTELYGSDGEEFAQRFRREVRLMKNFDHPNVLPILDVQLERQPYWFKMPLADASLGDWLSAHPDISDDIRIKIYYQILDGVKYLHDQDKYHRDIAPPNILIFNSDDPLVKLADFGLAKDGQSNTYKTAGSARGYGHQDYTAPEQLTSLKNANHLSDIYSLGGILYFLFSGKSPSNRFHENIPFQRIVDKAMQQRPENRYQSVDELRNEFQSAVERRKREKVPSFLGLANYRYTGDNFVDASNVIDLLLLGKKEGPDTVYNCFISPFLSIPDHILMLCCKEYETSMMPFLKTLSFNLEQLNYVPYGYDFSEWNNIDDKLFKMFYAFSNNSNRIEIVIQLITNAVKYNRFRAQRHIRNVFINISDDQLATEIAHAIEEYFSDYKEQIKSLLNNTNYPTPIRFALDDY